MAGDIHLDGQPYGGQAMRVGMSRWAISGALSSATTEKPFVFSQLELTGLSGLLIKAFDGSSLLM